MKILLYALPVSLCFYGCTPNDEPEVELPAEYQACCGVEPVEFKMAEHTVFIPNVFTPNSDGVNDLFYPFISEGISEVQGFTIFSAEGDTILFQRPTIVYDRLDEFAWNGKRNDGTYYKGRFKYGMRVVGKDRTMRLVEGEACSVLCEPGTRELKSRKGCFFPSQAGKAEKAGLLDSALSNNEKDCPK